MFNYNKNLVINEDFFDELDSEELNIDTDEIKIDEQEKQLVIEFRQCINTVNIKLLDDIQINQFIGKMFNIIEMCNIFGENDKREVSIYTNIIASNRSYVSDEDYLTDKNKLEYSDKLQSKLLKYFKNRLNIAVYNWQYQRYGTIVDIMFTFIFPIKTNVAKLPSYSLFKKDMLKIQSVCSQFNNNLQMMSTDRSFKKESCEMCILNKDENLYTKKSENSRLMSDIRMFTDKVYYNMYEELYGIDPKDFEDNNGLYGPGSLPNIYKILNDVNVKQTDKYVSDNFNVAMTGYRLMKRKNGICIFFEIDAKTPEFDEQDNYIDIVKRVFINKISCRDVLQVLKQSSSTKHDFDIQITIITKTRYNHKFSSDFVIENTLKSKNKFKFAYDFYFHLPYEMSKESYLNRTYTEAKQNYANDFLI